MPKSLEKTRKKIAKKKGDIGSLHENSRDSQRLRRAANRDDKLRRVTASRRKIDQPWITRAAFFQECIRKNSSKPLEVSSLQELIALFVHQHDTELSTLKHERRQGRPASTKEDLLKMKIAADEKEWESGFYLPDLTEAENVVLLDRWEGSWSYLTTLKWLRVSRTGNVQHASFPPKGKS